MQPASALERRIRPLALYALVCVVPFWIYAIVISFRATPGGGPVALSTPAMVWAVSVALTALPSFCVALRVLAKEMEMDPRLRERWIWTVLLTTLLGGPLFLVLRWWKERAPSTP